MYDVLAPYLTRLPLLQERSQDAETRLIETSAKLQEMQMKQKELEARNMLLVCCLLQFVRLCDVHTM